MLEVESGPAAAGEGAADNAADFEVRISDAHRKVESMRKRFERLRTVCISADQALQGVLSRSKVALREMHPSELTPASKIPQGTPPRATKRLERKERCAIAQPTCILCTLAIMYMCHSNNAFLQPELTALHVPRNLMNVDVFLLEPFRNLHCYRLFRVDLGKAQP